MMSPQVFLFRLFPFLFVRSCFFFFFFPPTDQKLFYRGRSASELHTRYMDTYLCRYGSVLPPHYLKRRPDGALEKVEIPLTDPDSCHPSDLGKMVRKEKHFCPSTLGDGKLGETRFMRTSVTLPILAKW